MSVEQFPLASVHRSPAAALADAGRAGLKNVVVIGDAEGGFAMIHAGDGQPLTNAEILWLLETCKMILMAPERAELLR